VNTQPQHVVLTYGTFDLFHVGHLNLLRNLKKLGHRLIVGVSTDEFNAVKGKRTVMPYEQRAQIVAAARYVDLVIPETDWAQKRRDIIEHRVTLFAMGDDWVGKFDDLGDLCEVLYLPRTKDVSTTEIKQLVRSQMRDQSLEILRATQRIQEMVSQMVG
jgi:glycerol-3-phosphate cytidylyltransferase